MHLSHQDLGDHNIVRILEDKTRACMVIKTVWVTNQAAKTYPVCQCSQFWGDRREMALHVLLQSRFSCHDDGIVSKGNMMTDMMYVHRPTAFGQAQETSDIWHSYIMSTCSNHLYCTHASECCACHVPLAYPCMPLALCRAMALI